MAYKVITGVYIIKNNINSKVYIGCSINISKRLNIHKVALQNNCHFNTHLQNSWNKYGKEAFSFIIWDICNENLLYAMECYWINLLDSTNKDYGYNKKSGDPNKHGGIHSEETKEKIRQPKLKQSKKVITIFTEEEKTEKARIIRYNRSIAAKNKGISPPPQEKKPVYCYKLSGEYICSYPSIIEAGIFLGIDKSSIGKCANIKHSVKSAGGFQWRFYKKEEGIDPYRAKTRKYVE